MFHLNALIEPTLFNNGQILWPVDFFPESTNDGWKKPIWFPCVLIHTANNGIYPLGFPMSIRLSIWLSIWLSICWFSQLFHLLGFWPPLIQTFTQKSSFWPMARKGLSSVGWSLGETNSRFRSSISNVWWLFIFLSILMAYRIAKICTPFYRSSQSGARKLLGRDVIIADRRGGARVCS